VGADRLNRPEGRGEGLVPVGAGADRSGEPAGHDGNVDNGADSSADAADAPPEMTEAYSPDVAIVNMYGKAGNLGLHQDCDESAQSLLAGSPVVSISLGDSCVFVLGPPTDSVGGASPSLDACQFVRLYSGDMLVFGGPSRLAWHGVKMCFAGTAPRYLSLPERPCRLNLTLRCL